MSNSSSELLTRLERLEEFQLQTHQSLVDLGALVKQGAEIQHNALIKYSKIQSEATQGILESLSNLELIIKHISERLDKIEPKVVCNSKDLQEIKEQNKQISERADKIEAKVDYNSKDLQEIKERNKLISADLQNIKKVLGQNSIVLEDIMSGNIALTD